MRLILFIVNALTACLLSKSNLIALYFAFIKMQSILKKSTTWLIFTHLFGDFSLFPFFYATDGDTCNKLKYSFIQFRKSVCIF